ACGYGGAIKKKIKKKKMAILASFAAKVDKTLIKP
ncbi:hypothetical protein LCGC14_2171590, partial [marine sediment metagenome]